MGHTAKDCFTIKTNKESITTNICHYCKKPGHLINQCKKRIYAESQKNLNGNSSQSATRVAQQQPTRSTNCVQEENLEELLLQLIPMERDEQ